MIWNFDPVAFSLFDFDIRWYGLVYFFGFLLTYWLGYRLHQSLSDHPLKKDDYQNVVFYAFVFGVIGGRLGLFLFYHPSTLLEDPLEIFKVWHGGMSIHGGILGTVFYLWYASRKYNRSFFDFSDSLVLPLAFTLIFGRFANFLNGELVGQPTRTDWGVIFPHIDEQLRHPTQLYESGKNILLSLLLGTAFFFGFAQKKGLLTALFLIGYGVGRFIIEFWKNIGWTFLSLNTGQWFCLFMILIGGIILFRSTRSPAVD